MNAKKRIAIIDDHKLFRDGLKSMIKEGDDVEVVGEAGDGREGIRIVKNVMPDLLLLDLAMPKLGGLSVLADLKRELPGMKILVSTLHESEKYVAEVFEIGADGYFVKTGRWEELLFAIHQVIGGKTYISPSIAGNILQGYIAAHNTSEPAAASPQLLTGRELQVLNLLASGHKRKAIAELMSIGDEGVETHLENMMAKLKLDSTHALVGYAFKNGL